MSNLHRVDSEEPHPWAVAMKGEDIPYGPGQLLVVQTLARIEQARSNESIKQSKWSRVLNRTRWLLAASLLFILVLPYFVVTNNIAAFDLVQEKVQQAESLSCIASYQLLGWKFESLVLMRNDYLRIEDRIRKYEGSLMSVTSEDLEKKISVIDLKTQQFLILNTDRKTCQRGTVQQLEVAKWANPVEQIRRVMTASAKHRGQEKIQGKLTEHFVIKSNAFLGIPIDTRGEMHVWSDPNSKLPMQIEIRETNGDTTVVRFSEMSWNKPLGAELFALTVPTGYRMVTSSRR